MNSLLDLPRRVLEVGSAPFLPAGEEEPEMIEPMAAHRPSAAAKPVPADRVPQAALYPAEEIEARARELAEKLARDRVGAVVERLARALQAFERDRADKLRELEFAAIRLAYEVARKVIHREITTAPDVILHTVRSVLRRLGQPGPVLIVCHPDDLPLLRDSEILTASLQAHGAHVELKGEYRIERGGCHIETGKGTFDATISGQLERLGDLLFSEQKKSEAGQ